MTRAVLIALLLLWPSVGWAQDATKLYAPCKACHLANGKGVPGAFPPLGAQVLGLAGSAQGRTYLALVLSRGLSGKLEIDGKTYRGIMPAQGRLKDDELAALLNYVMSDISGPLAGTHTPPKPFTAEEITTIQAEHPKARGRKVLALRPTGDLTPAARFDTPKKKPAVKPAPTETPIKTAAAKQPVEPAPKRPKPAARKMADMPGVTHMGRARQDWILQCQGCHRADASGSADTTPAMNGMVGKFLHVEGGRNYLIQVPGVSTAPLSDKALTNLLNWTLWTFDAANIPDDFKPYSITEITALRKKPLRANADEYRATLVARIEETLGTD